MVNIKVRTVQNVSPITPDAFSRLLDETLQNELPTPYCSFTDHTLPVTDVVCGVGAFPSCRILTASVDHTVKVCPSSFSPHFHFSRRHP